jgi:pimeloyl-ACP methyl ester carboxylesterase
VNLLTNVATGALVALALGAAALVSFLAFVILRYGKYIERVILHKPLLIAETQPHRQDDEQVEFQTPSGRTLRGSYFHVEPGKRRGVVAFGHEYGGDRWLFETYLGPLVDAGYEVFAFDFANHGRSDRIPDYEPNQWLTHHEVEDAGAALDYLAARADADPRGMAAFGVSKGGSAMLAAAAERPFVRALVTDGSYPNHGMIVEYEMKWVGIFSSKRWLYSRLPRIIYVFLCEVTLRRLARKFQVRYTRLETALRRYGGRPYFAIRGGRDNYVTATIFDRFLALADPASVVRWTVDGAKHNLCLQRAGAEYHRRVRAFFDGVFPTSAAPAAAASVGV